MGRAILRHLVQILAVAGLVTAAGAWPAHAWGGAAGLGALFLAAAVCLVGAAVARIVQVLLTRVDSRPEAAPQALQLAITVRLLLTLALSTPFLLLEPVPALQLAVWLGLHYLGQLVLELFVSIRDLGQNLGPTGPASAGATEGGPLPTPSDDGGTAASAQGATRE